MSPEAFKFTLTVPADARLVGVVRDVCAHAAGYARLSESAGTSFCDQVARAVEAIVAANPRTPCPLVFECREGELRVAVADQTLVQPISV